MLKKPSVDVILAARNAEDSVSECLSSIFDNCCGVDIRVLVFDDASTDNTARIVRQFQSERVELFVGADPVGLPGALNFLISKVSAPFIARMDADDIVLNDRFTQQAEFLQLNPDIDVCGTFAHGILPQLETRLLTRPLTARQAYRNLVWEPPCIHPTVMFRSELLKANRYDERFLRAQDWELFSRIMTRTLVVNVPIVGLEYRVSGGLTIAGLRYKLWAGILVSLRTRRLVGIVYSLFNCSRLFVGLIRRRLVLR